MSYNRQVLQKSVLLSLIYVSLGTFSILGSDPKSKFYGDWSDLVSFVTFPVNIIGFGYTYAESNYLPGLLLIQFGVFVVFTWLVYILLVRRSRKK